MRINGKKAVAMVALATALGAARASQATVWPASSGGSVPVCTAGGIQQSPAVIPDNTGGAYVAWVDQRSGAAVYLQRLTRLGGVWPGWPNDGVLICTSSAIAPTPSLVSDYAGGVIVAWMDSRGGGDIYAQRVDPAGLPQWSANGVAVCTASGPQFQPRIASDGSGGVVLAWEDGRGASRDVYAQRVSAAGVPQWTANGVPVGSGAGNQSYPDIVEGESGSTIIAWTDSRSGNNDVYAQRLSSSGSPMWAANGVLMVTNAQHQDSPRVAPDGSGGAYVVFQDQRSFGITGVDIYAQRVNSSGVIQWGVMGVPVCTMGLNQERPVVVTTPSGVVIAWEDYRPGTLPATRDIFAQKLYSSGSAAWMTDGIDLASYGGDQFGPAIVSDGKQGVIVAWTDTRAAVGDIFGARVDSSGVLSPGWIEDGTPMNATPAEQRTAAIASDGMGGAIVVFGEYSSMSSYDIRAQRIGRFGRPEVEAVAMIPDGSCGSFVAWEDYAGGDADVRIQRFTGRGAVAPGWPPDGVLVASASGNQQHPSLCEDGAGGVFVAWEDARSGPFNHDVYVQRVNGLGAIDPAWPTDGINIIDPFFDFDEHRPQLVPDGSGGAYVAWVNGTLGVGVLNAQRIDANGSRQFGSPNGIALLTGYDSFSIAADGVGGLIVCYENFQFPRMTAVMRRDAAGYGWGPVFPAPGVPQHEPLIVADGAGGAYVAWRAETGGPPTPSQIMIQRLDASGAIATGWPAGGIPVTLAVGNQYDLALAADGLGGAILAWTDERTAGVPDLYAQRLTPAGVAAWTADGLAVSTAVSDQTAPVLVSDGAGGALVAWQDRRGGNTDVYAQRITAAGLVAGRWTAGGVLVAQLPAIAVNEDQHALAIAGDGGSGAHLAWYDTRGGGAIPDVRMLRMDAFAIAGDHGLAIARVRDVPGDQGGRVQITWSAHVLDRSPGFEIAEYWIWRQIPESAALATLATEAAAFGEAGFANRRPRRGQVMRAESVPGAYWEFLEAQPATGFSGYGYVAATTSDSGSIANPYTAFLVQARHRTVLAFWNSAPDSGYSVDNLAPGPPTAFVVHYFDGSASAASRAEVRSASQGTPYAWLHWAPSAEKDFAEYRIHRGGSAGFEPGPGNLIATRSDTGYVDLGAPPSFYKLVAVDVHGNASVAAAAAPSGLLGAPSLEADAVRFGLPSPNPSAGEVTLRFSLPRRADARLEVFDAAGRLVGRLAGGTHAAGEHTVRWDGRDLEGNRVRDGLYFVRLVVAGEESTRRITMLR